MGKKRTFLSIFLAGIVSLGGSIGFGYLGINIGNSWIKLLILAVIGSIFGGLIGGIVSQNSKRGSISGILSGIFVFLGIFLVVYLTNRDKIIGYQNLVLEDPYIDMLLDYWQIKPGMKLYDYLEPKYLTALEESISNQKEFYNSPLVILFSSISAMNGSTLAQ